MKNVQLILLSFLSVLAFQSCSVTGLMLGAIGDASAPHDETESVYRGGWDQSTKKNKEVKLKLEDGTWVKGRFIREYIDTDSVTTLVVKSLHGYQNIPVHEVERTAQLRKRKTDHKKKGFIIGLGFDVILLLVILAAENSDTCLMLCGDIGFQIK